MYWICQVFADNFRRQLRVVFMLLRREQSSPLEPPSCLPRRMPYLHFSEVMWCIGLNVSAILILLVGTIQRLEVHVAQHVPHGIRRRPNLSTIRLLSQSQESIIYSHLWDSNTYWTGYLDNCFTVVCKARNKTHLAILEALVIIEYRPSLYRQKNLQANQDYLENLECFLSPPFQVFTYHFAFYSFIVLVICYIYWFYLLKMHQSKGP